MDILNKRFAPERLEYFKSNYKHLCTETLEKKIFYLYFNVFDKILESEPGLQKYEYCDNLYFYAMTNFFKEEPDILKPCMYPCIYCYGDPEEINEEENDEKMMQQFRNLFC